MKTLQHYQKEYTKDQIGNNQKMTQYYDQVREIPFQEAINIGLVAMKTRRT